MSSVNNRKLAKNTIYLYLRMLVVMVISLYTVRAILDILGIIDYGIYNVVGGIVTMFAFMNRTLSTSSQRYFSIELARGDINKLEKWFSLNITAFFSLGILIVFLLETIGLWFVNVKMTIPDNRLMAANVVYQLSILSFLVQIVAIPYIALVIAHEKMKVFAYIGVIEAIGRLLIVYVLMIQPWDNLIIYGILILLLSVGISFSYVLYCWRHYPESIYHWYWNTIEIKELFGFSGWHFLGTFSTTCRSQGINILLNIIFNPAINASRAIAFQVNSHLMQLSNNFFTALKPQIYKTYAVGDYVSLYKLLFRGTIISTFLVSVVIFPIWSNTNYIMSLWLKNVPDYVVVFTQLTLINGLIDSTNHTLFAASLATGKIKGFMFAVSLIMFCNLPISYLFLLIVNDPTIVFYVSIILSLINVIVMAYILKAKIAFPFIDYLFLLFKLLLISAVLMFVLKCAVYNKVNDLLSLIAVFILVELLIILFYSTIVTREDRELITKAVLKKIRRGK